ncbi:TIR domain-containing protein [Peribacillus frigoritolerans]|uniref:TIR domain-containing protein n=1 Tax=Peribacillus frigoritolerans TaxID=450367 RepID=UPI00399F0E90
MDALRRLSLELDGIIGEIHTYTSGPTVKNMTENLSEAVKAKNIKETLYFLNKLDKWYDKNWHSIITNQFVDNENEHKDTWDNIKQFIRELQKKKEFEFETSSSPSPIANEVVTITENVEATVDRTKVFIVHGHDELAQSKAARFVEKLGFETIILHEQASSGKTIIEKIEKYSNVGFGIVLYTPCDIGAKNEPEPKFQTRARQNVVFEHGFLMGKIGRSNVCALIKDEVEAPNDISGVVYVTMDSHDAWKNKVAKEMLESGYKIDMNKL